MSKFELRYVLLILPFCLYMGCGSPDKKVPASGSEIGNGLTGIIGEWDGILMFKSKGSRLENTEANSNLEEPIKVIFEGTSEQQGTFMIKLKNAQNGVVRGSFVNFAAKSLMLSINESNVSSFGLNGSFTDIPYELTGNSLLLSNEKMTIKLARRIENSEGETKKPNEVPRENQLSKRWKCDDGQGKVWLVNIRKDQKFTIDIASEIQKASFMWLDGRVEGNDPLQVILIVEKASNPKYVGLKLVADMARPQELLLRRSASDELTAFEKINCTSLI